MNHYQKCICRGYLIAVWPRHAKRTGVVNESFFALGPHAQHCAAPVQFTTLHSALRFKIGSFCRGWFQGHFFHKIYVCLIKIEPSNWYWKLSSLTNYILILLHHRILSFHILIPLVSHHFVALRVWSISIFFFLPSLGLIFLK